MEILSYASLGFEGVPVSIDVDIRRGIPGLDIVGLPDSAVREARERIRIAIKRSGYDFPLDKILFNLAPAGIRKEGAHFDLPLAAALLEKTGQLPSVGIHTLLLMGELHLNGEIRGVRGVLPALMGALSLGIDHFIIPESNHDETRPLRHRGIHTLKHLSALPELLMKMEVGLNAPLPLSEDFSEPGNEGFPCEENFSDMVGQGIVKRALEIASAGRHNVLLFGPPGSGKTMAARRFSGLFPNLKREDSLDITRIWSLAGKLEGPQGVITRPVLRTPHHSASLEGLIGGGPRLEPGEVSLAHKGILFLDETPEFGASILQSLREPLETGEVCLSRAGQRYWFPADFQLVMAANPCPCGNLGREEGYCVCSALEISRYWKKLGGALLDRIDIRVPVKPVHSGDLLSNNSEESTETIRERVEAAAEKQEKRYAGLGWDRNSRIPPGMIKEFCRLETSAASCFNNLTAYLKLSSRASHSLLKTARTIADLADHSTIEENDLLEASQFRRYGDRDIYWSRFD